jgi:predicted dehydrogenase
MSLPLEFVFSKHETFPCSRRVKSKLKWGILATGGIAKKFALGVAASRTGVVVAAGSRTEEAARRFATEHRIPRAHGSYEALLADPEVAAVYVATPHPGHLEWVLKAAEAGKHILCEKPLGMSRAEGARMIDAARRHGVFLMEAFMYRCHAQTVKIAGLVRDGALGRVGLVQAAFGINRPFDPKSRLWARELGGGGILDTGCYPVSLARLVAGAAAGKAFLDPVEVTGAGLAHPETGVDVYAAATLRFETGMIAQVSAGIGLQQDNSARIYGTKGWLHVPWPWKPTRNGDADARIWLHREGAAAPEELVLPFAGDEYALEADVVAEAIAAGLVEAAPMSWADTLGNLGTLDRWRSAAGVAY